MKGAVSNFTITFARW